LFPTSLQLGRVNLFLDRWATYTNGLRVQISPSFPFYAKRPWENVRLCTFGRFYCHKKIDYKG
jgi:hypothetical protein